MPLAGRDLVSLVSPVDADEFVRTRFLRRSLVLQRRGSIDPPPLAIGDVEVLLADLQVASLRWVRLVKAGAAVPMESPLIDPSGGLQPDEVWDRYRQGCTIVLNQLHKRWPPVARLCAGLRDQLQRRWGVPVKGEVTANAYLTPPDSGGFSAHVDDHEVFVLQLDGQKQWLVYEDGQGVEEGRRRLLAGEAGEPCQRPVLSPGDLLYLPEGTVHEAYTSESHSLHLSIGLRTHRLRDLLLAIARVEPQLGEPLPWWHADGAGSIGSRITAAVAEAMRPAGLERARAIMEREGENSFLRWSGRLDEINRSAAITASTVLRRTSGPTWALETTGDEVTIDLPDGSFALPARLRPALEFMAGAELFTLDDLPESVVQAEGRQLVKALMEQGMLERTSVA